MTACRAVKLAALAMMLIACTADRQPPQLTSPDAAAATAWAQIDVLDMAFVPVPCGMTATGQLAIVNRGDIELMIVGASLRDSLGELTFDQLDSTDARCRGGIDCAIDPGIPVPPGATRSISVHCAPPASATSTDLGQARILSNTIGGRDTADVSCPTRCGS